MRGYEIDDQTLRDVIKRKQKIKFSGTSDSPKATCNRKRMKTSTYEGLDKVMVLWFNQQKQQLPEFLYQVLNVLLKRNNFSKKLEIHEDSSASSGWLRRFKQR